MNKQIYDIILFCDESLKEDDTAPPPTLRTTAPAPNPTQRRGDQEGPQGTKPNKREEHPGGRTRPGDGGPREPTNTQNKTHNTHKNKKQHKQTHNEHTQQQCQILQQVPVDGSVIHVLAPGAKTYIKHPSPQSNPSNPSNLSNPSNEQIIFNRVKSCYIMLNQF